MRVQSGHRAKRETLEGPYTDRSHLIGSALRTNDDHPIDSSRISLPTTML